MNQASVSDGVKPSQVFYRTIVVFVLLSDLNVLALVNRASMMCSGQPLRPMRRLINNMVKTVTMVMLLV